MLKIVGNKYFLRTPLYPVSYTHKCFSDDITSIMDRPEFMFGLYIASKDLYEEYKRQLETGKVTKKMINSLQKYWLRASTRCTPYANFAGCSLGTMGETTNICLNEPERFENICRLDMDLLHKILELLYKDDKVKNQITYYTNNSLYVFAEQFRYVRYNHESMRTYFLSEADATPYLKEIISLCVKGATVTKMTALLLKYDVAQDDARGYIDSLINMQLISSELEPCITGKEPYDQLIGLLSKYNDTEVYTNLIKQIQGELKKNVYSIEQLQKIITDISNAGISTSVKTLFQCDLKKSLTANTISKKTIETILSQINELLYLTYKKAGNIESLEIFKRKFMEKYESQTIPLSEALDVENGIGYGDFTKNINTFIGDLSFTPDPDKNKPVVTDFIQKQLNAAANVIQNHIHITRKDVNLKEGKKFIFPFSFNLQQNVSLMGSLFGDSTQEIDNGNFSFAVKSLGGSSHANMLARFSHLDSSFEEWIVGLTKSEEEALPADIVYAEIVHLPQERLGNILSRAVLRSYEIPYLGNSGALVNNQIPLSDLLIKIENGEIILRSKRLNKRVIPRLTTAHNYSFKSLPVYKFLCDLQNQNSFVGISWSSIIKGSTGFTPRVSYENLIIQRASWRLTKEDIASIPKDDNDLLKFFTVFRSKRNMPDRLVYQESDNELLIDFNYADSIHILLNYIEKHGQALLVEFLGDEKGFFVNSDIGNYSNEILIPLKIEATPVEGTGKAIDKLKTKEKRVFMPCEEWVYYKIYCSNNFADQLLTSSIHKLVTSLTKKKLVEKFFFIRYSDPDFHLRLRIKLKKEEDFLVVTENLKKLLSKLIKMQLVNKLQIDTYVREIERYGGDLITESESIFNNDSIAVLGVLKIMNENEEDQLRWNVALAGVDYYLNDFGYDIKKKITLITRLQKSFFNEFGGSLALQRSLNDKYRTLKEKIFSSLTNSNHELDEYVGELNKRSALNAPIIKKIKAAEDAEKLVDELLPSYLHMFVNRFFASENRKYELTLYHLLLKYYTSVQAMKENAGTQVTKEKPVLA